MPATQPGYNIILQGFYDIIAWENSQINNLL